MKSSEYLYGNIDMTEIRELPYIQALHRKNIYAKELIDQLLEVPYMERDGKRLSDIGKAIKFNQSLIDECFEKDTE